jgi:hypothetical protein
MSNEKANKRRFRSIYKRLDALENPEVNEDDPPISQAPLLVSLTPKQCTYLSKMARLRKMGQVIEAQMADGFIFVRGTEEGDETEGAGIWVDTNGEEQDFEPGVAQA